MKTLPSEPFEIGRWQRFKLGNDYHVRIDGVAYSVPFGLIGKKVDVHCTASTAGGKFATVCRGYKRTSLRKAALEAKKVAGTPCGIFYQGACRFASTELRGAVDLLRGGPIARPLQYSQLCLQLLDQRLMGSACSANSWACDHDDRAQRFDIIGEIGKAWLIVFLSLMKLMRGRLAGFARSAL